MNTTAQQLEATAACRDHDAPLCVDLDGTLVKTDMLLESLLVLMKKNPLYALLLPLWLLKGRAHLKHEIARRVSVNVACLPYHKEFLEFLESERLSGRRLVLTTASDATFAQQVAAHLKLFDDVLASDGKTNLAGREKLLALRRRFSPGGFGYAGNAARDLTIWREANTSIVVGSGRLIHKARKVAQVDGAFENKRKRLQTVLKAIRVHQWVKNLLVFVPLLVSHNITNPALVLNATWSFLAFSLCASSMYLLNDLLDLETDRQHSQKRRRPLASGDLSIGWGMALLPLLLASGFAFAAFLPFEFLIILLLYFTSNLAYSFRLKQAALLDVILLASLYTIRILAGAVAIGVVVSSWLLSFSMFLFLSLAFVKRYSEVRSALRHDGEAVKGRGYFGVDREHLANMGTASGYISVLVLGLYISSPQVTLLYARPEILWLACPAILYWVSRVWLIAYRGQMNHDPLVFAIKDKASYVVGIVTAALMLLAK